ncbi:hypothetical protein ACUODF_15430, partial [Escherichia coli]
MAPNAIPPAAWALAGICYSSLAILPSFLSYAE